MSDRPDVLIAGAGPTGLTLGCDLIRRGLRVRIVDSADGPFGGSRAKGLQPRSLEVFHDLGLTDAVAGRGTEYPLLAIHLGPVAVPWGMFARRKPSEDVPYPNPLLIAQSDTNLVLRERLEELGGQVDYGARLTSFRDNGEGVVAIVEGADGPDQIESRFLIGADGGGSTVRRQLGVNFVGTTDESDRLIVADVTVEGLRRDRWHAWPRTDGRAVSLCPLPGTDRFQLIVRMRPDEEIGLDTESLDRIVGNLPGRAQPRVRDVSWASGFRPNVRLTSRYRVGNVFLAGDAAHVHTPAGAQGMNTGIQDAYNLGWKLGQVVAGAPESLLDSYEDERRPIAARVLGLSDEIYRSRSFRALKRGAEERQLVLNYRGGPLAREAAAESSGDVRAGDRVPDARFTDPDGRPGRVFDATRGPGFTLLAYGTAAIEGLDGLDWPSAGVPLSTLRIARSDGPRRWFGADRPTQALIRPDGYLAYRATGDWARALSRAAATMAPPVRTPA